jgi:hypothetical protein
MSICTSLYFNPSIPLEVLWKSTKNSTRNRWLPSQDLNQPDSKYIRHTTTKDHSQPYVIRNEQYSIRVSLNTFCCDLKFNLCSIIQHTSLLYSESHGKQFHTVLPSEKEELHTKVAMLIRNESFVVQTISTVTTKIHYDIICDKEQ